MNWPLRYRFWHWLHCQVNRLAWRYASDEIEVLPSLRPIHYKRDGHWLWRLNDFLAKRWSDWWMSNRHDF